MSVWTHMATGILLVVPSIVALSVIARRTSGLVKPAYQAADARRSMVAAGVASPVPSFNCASRGLSR